MNAAGDLDVFLSEDILKGEDWQDKIEDALYNSDWFILLYSGSDEDWSWCHHEAGVFRGMMYPIARRIVVFHPPNVKLPKPLERFQAVKCADQTQPNDVDRFLCDFYGVPCYPDFKELNGILVAQDDDRKAVADKIIDSVGKIVINKIEPDNELIVRVLDVAHLRSDTFPTKACIESSALRLFRFGTDKWSWGEFKQTLQTRDPDLAKRLDKYLWRVICDACKESIQRRHLMSIYTLFRAPLDSLNYKPILNSVEIAGDNSAMIRINFVHVAAGSQVDVRNKSIARVFTALNLAHRFRWEIIDLYTDREKVKQLVECDNGESQMENGSSTGDGLGKVWEAIVHLETEARNRGVYDEDELPLEFGPERSKITSIFSTWEKKRQRLKEAIEQQNAALFSDTLADLDVVNVDFICLAAKRLSDLVRADFDERKKERGGDGKSGAIRRPRRRSRKPIWFVRTFTRTRIDGRPWRASCSN